MSDTACFAGPLWRWTADNGVSWFFVTIDGKVGEDLSAIEAMRRLERVGNRGFRSVKVEVEIGNTRWRTSCFPRREGGWLLPVKAAVRKAEGIDEGDEIALTLRAV